MSDTNNTKTFIPEGIRDQELFVKTAELVDYVITEFNKEISDVKYKRADPDKLDEDAIKELIKEIGFSYITDIMETIDDFQFNTLVHYVSLISLLKGHRDGLELILRLLGFDSLITEWWQKTPKGTPTTYDLIVLMNTTFIPDVFTTLDKVQIFARHYVWPTIEVIDFRFSIDSFAEANLNVAGFVKNYYGGTIRQRVTF